MRTPGHETLARCVGQWVGRNDSKVERERDMYHAKMLVLLKPWREIKDIKKQDETFEGAFQAMLGKADKRTLTMVHNFQYFYECVDGAR
ncbi:hypothetical protein CPC08DRAFT_635701, partial [Agrocybe pediades]